MRVPGALTPGRSRNERRAFEVQSGIRLLPFTMTPIVIAPLAAQFPTSTAVGRSSSPGSRSKRPLRLGRAARVDPSRPRRAALALFVAGAGTSIALPTVPTANLGAVAPADIGTASEINDTMQRFGAVFAVAIATSVFAAFSHLDSPTGITDGFRPAVGVSALLALLGAVAALVLERRARTTEQLAPAAIDLAA
jgi:hypothetical protein